MLDDRRVEELSSGRSRGAGIRVVVGETTGFAHTADLSEPGFWRRPGPPPRWPAEGGDGVRTVALDPLSAHGPGDRTPPRLAWTRRASSSCSRAADEAARSAGDAITQVQVGCGDSRRRLLDRQLRRPAGRGRPDPHPLQRRVRRQRRHRHADGLRVAGPHRGLRDLRALPSRGGGPTRGGPRPGQALGPPRALGRGPGGAGRRQRRHPVPRGVRARARGRPHRQGRFRLHRPGRRAGGQPAGHPGRRRHGARGVGQLRHGRRGPPAGAQRA